MSNTPPLQNSSSMTNRSKDPLRVPLSPKFTARAPSHRDSDTPGTARLFGAVNSGNMDVVSNDWTPTEGSAPRKSRPLQQLDRYIPNASTKQAVASAQFSLARKEELFMLKQDLDGTDNPAATDKDGEDGEDDEDDEDDKQRHNIDQASTTTARLEQHNSAYAEAIARAQGHTLDQRVLAFGAAPPTCDSKDIRASHNQLLKTATTPHRAAAARRHIATAPERVLDAPGVVDDYYLNLLDWSIENVLVIGMEQVAYLWNAHTSQSHELHDASEHGLVASLRFSSAGDYVAVGYSEGDIIIYDTETCTKTRTLKGRTARTTSLSWSGNTLSSGCRDGSIWHHDVRVAQHKTAELMGHTGDVCGLEWRNDGQLLASGGNDNLLNVWDARAANAPRFTKANHTAAVKALAWYPWQSNVLATGGGSRDKCIHFWNVNNGALLSTIEAGSQVTSLIWSQHSKELLSTHGYPDNRIAIWDYTKLERIIDFPAHESRVLSSALSPDGQVVATISSDENLKLWRVFEGGSKGVKLKHAGDKRSKHYKNICIR